VGGRDVMKDPARTNQLIRLNTIDEAILSICSVESGEGACQMKDEVLKGPPRQLHRMQAGEEQCWSSA